MRNGLQQSWAYVLPCLDLADTLVFAYASFQADELAEGILVVANTIADCRVRGIHYVDSNTGEVRPFTDILDQHGAMRCDLRLCWRSGQTGPFLVAG